MWTENEYMNMFFENDANEGMKYSVGDTVMYVATGQFAVIKKVDAYNRTYTIDIHGTESVVCERELS